MTKPLVLISFVNELTRAVANSLASTTGMPLRLRDGLVEHRLGTSSVELMVDAGLETWREREKLELASTVKSEPFALIAIGEGTLVDAASLELVLERCDLVYLCSFLADSTTFS